LVEDGQESRRKAISQKKREEILKTKKKRGVRICYYRGNDNLPQFEEEGGSRKSRWREKKKQQRMMGKKGRIAKGPPRLTSSLREKKGRSVQKGLQCRLKDENQRRNGSSVNIIITLRGSYGLRGEGGKKTMWA